MCVCGTECEVSRYVDRFRTQGAAYGGKGEREGVTRAKVATVAESQSQRRRDVG